MKNQKCDIIFITISLLSLIIAEPLIPESSFEQLETIRKLYSSFFLIKS